MALINVESIIIKEDDYQEFDKILKVMTSNKIFTVIALGVRKSFSKNRNGIILGSYSELEIFEARLNNKISKLKKAHLIKNFDILNEENNLIVKELFTYLNKIEKNTQMVFNAYLECLNEYGKGYNYFIKTYIVSKILRPLGLKVNFEACYECKSNKNLANFSFFEGGFSCKNHAKKILETNLLRSYYFLNISFKKYLDNTSSEKNALIFQNLKNYIDENVF